MKLGVRILRYISRAFEDERMEFRRLIHYAEAHCDDLLKQLRNGRVKSLSLSSGRDPRSDKDAP